MRSYFGSEHLVSADNVLYWQTTSCFSSQHLVLADNILFQQSASCFGRQRLVLAVSVLSHIRQAVADLRDVGLLGSRLALIWRAEPYSTA